MKSLPMIVIAACAALLVGVAIFDHQQLPGKLASHFDSKGIANGWMSSSSLTLSMIVIGLAIPAFVIGIMYSVRFFPANCLNVPNSTYWRQPENYKKAYDFLFTSSLWFGSTFLLWQVFFSHMIVEANQVSPPRLDSGKVLLLTVPLLVSTLAWVVVLMLRFLRTEQAGGTDSTTFRD